MLFMRGVMGLCLLAGLLCFALYRWTGQPRWRTRALRLVLGTVGAVMAFATLIWLQTL